MGHTLHLHHGAGSDSSGRIRFHPLGREPGVDNAPASPDGFVRAIEREHENIVVRHVSPENRRIG